MLGAYVELLEDLKFTMNDFLGFIGTDVVIIENRLQEENVKEIANELFAQLLADKFLDGINKEELK